MCFSPPPEADLSDTLRFPYPVPQESRQEVTQEEVSTAIAGLKADKAPGPDGIPNRVLKVLDGVMTQKLTPIFNACASLAYHPRAFKEVHTIILKKPDKRNLTIPKAYRPIALLNTMGKVLEIIMAKKITNLAETHKLLPEQHMGARRGRGAESALDLIVEQVHAIWG